ncbi:armadillo-like helical domain-containing protein 3 isoform X1 [Oratosquilla oratoria]|uniref:armadillo-like helical domain-containing protein 3 isoform X1 n=1 Tax=Oratosquilla oratoria TaxID=337810 RepID=UPI003F76BB4D
MGSKLKPVGVVRRHLKEKVVQMYEDLFHGSDPVASNPRFWEDLFLLKPKMSALEGEISRCTSDQLQNLKENINTLFAKCVETLSHEHQIRVVNALLTLCSLVRGLYRKMQGDFGFDFINILIGFDAAEDQMQLLLDYCSNFLTGEFCDSLKSLTLKFLLVLATGTDNISQNTVLEYLTINCNFDAVIQLLSHSSTRNQHGPEAVLYLMLMVNYRKHEMTNPYTVQLSLLDDELILNGYGQLSCSGQDAGMQGWPVIQEVITASLTEFNHKYSAHFMEPHGSGWFASLTSMVGSMFVSEEMATRNEHIKANDSFLLALYEAVHLNRNFITALTTATDPSTPPSPANTLDRGTTPPSTDEQGNQNGESANNKNELEVSIQPTNLLVTFLEYCSLVMQDTKTEESLNNVKLCFVIITCIAEDQYCDLLLHDANLVFTVPLHRLPMRHRKILPEKTTHARPLACAVLDLMVEFMMSHMMKKLPLELFMQSVGVVHRLLCYQKRNSVRLQYNWKELWAALIALAKFLVTNEAHLAKKMNIFQLAHQLLNIFNLFITYGDTFLSTPSSYDELYYEIMRMHQVFENLYSMSLRYSRTDGDYKESAQKLTNCLGNVRLIINHFTPKLDKWSQEHGVATLTEEQVLEVVRNNYESLTLKLHDSLDQFEKYSEKPRHANFFANMVRSILSDTRQGIDFSAFENLSILQELSQSS